MEVNHQGTIGWNVSENVSLPGEFRLRPMDEFRLINHAVVSTIGIPLNSFVIFIIVSNRRLNKKPRNILNLGITIANLFTLITTLVEFLAHYYSNIILCKAFVVMNAVAYIILLFNVLLALLDRCAALAYPLAHRRRVTVSRVLVTQIVSTLVIVLSTKFSYIFLAVPVECAILIEHYRSYTAVISILVLLCISTEIAVYVKIKQTVCPNREVIVSYNGGAVQEVNVQIGSLATSDADHERSQGHAVSSRSQMDGMRIHCAKNRDMEVDATWNLLHGVLPLLIFIVPTMALRIAEWCCFDETARESIGAVAAHARELVLYHLIYNPTVYMCFNREFSSTLKDKWCRIRVDY